MSDPNRTTRTMQYMIAECVNDESVAETLRDVATKWIAELPPRYLAQVGQILLDSHIQEQRDNLAEN